MRNWIPVMVFASVALTVYYVLITKRRRSERWTQRRWSSGSGGDISLGSDGGSAWYFSDLFSSSSSTDSSGNPTDSSGSDSSGSDSGSGDGGGGGDGGGD